MANYSNRAPFIMSCILSLNLSSSVFASNEHDDINEDSMRSTSSTSSIHSPHPNNLESISSISDISDHFDNSENSSNQNIQDWKTFDNSKRVCLAKHSYGKIKNQKAGNVIIGGTGLGMTAGIASAITIPFVTVSAVLTTLYVPWIGVPALGYLGYKGHKQHIQNSRQNKLLKLMFTPEKEIQSLFEIHAHAQNYSNSKSISQNYKILFAESMKTNSYMCNYDGSLKSLEEGSSFLIDESEILAPENMSSLESEIAIQTAEYLKFKNARELIKSHIKDKMIAKNKHLLHPLSLNKKADYLQQKKNLKDTLNTLNEKDIFLTFSPSTKAEGASRELKRRIKSLLPSVLNLVEKWVQSEGILIAAKNIEEYNKEIATYPKISMKQKFQKWHMKKSEKRQAKKELQKAQKLRKKERCENLENELKVGNN